MDSNLPEQPIVPAQPIQPSIPLQTVIKAKKSLPKWPILITGAIILLFLIGGAYTLGQKSMVKPAEKTQTVTQLPATTPTIKPSNQALQISPTQSATYLQIPELNIKITLSDEIKDLTYSPKTNNGKTSVYFSTNSLANAGEKEKTNGVNYCAADKAPLGSFSKIYKADLTEDPNQPWWNRLSSLRDVTKETTDKSGVKRPILAKEFSDFFIFYTTPQSTCSNNASISNLQSSSIKAIEKTIPTIELIP